MDATQTTGHLEETIDNFKKYKIKDRKSVFSDCIKIEMLFHGKTWVLYTVIYWNIQKIDKDKDIELFWNSLYPPR